MYSPKIAEDLIPRLYRRAKAECVPMTRLVDRIIRVALAEQMSSEAGRPETDQAPADGAA